MSWQVTVVSPNNSSEKNNFPGARAQLSTRDRTAKKYNCHDEGFAPVPELAYIDALKKLQIGYDDNNVWEKNLPNYAGKNIIELPASGAVISKYEYNIESIQATSKLSPLAGKEKIDCPFKTEGVVAAGVDSDDPVIHSVNLYEYITQGDEIPLYHGVTEAKGEYSDSTSVTVEGDVSTPADEVLEPGKYLYALSWPHIYVDNLGSLPDGIISFQVREAEPQSYCYSETKCSYYYGGHNDSYLYKECERSDFECHEVATLAWSVEALGVACPATRPAFIKGTSVHVERANCFGLWSGSTSIDIKAEWIISDEFPLPDDFDPFIRVVAVYNEIEESILVAAPTVFENEAEGCVQNTVATAVVYDDGTFTLS